MDEVEKVTAQSYSVLGQAYFALGDYRKSMSSLETAISMAEEEGYKPRENWYSLLALSPPPCPTTASLPLFVQSE